MSKKGLKIVVVGAGKVGDTLVNRLADEGHNLVIIDKNVERLNQLADQCDCMCIPGNGASHEILEEAGVSEADLFIAVTESDELNLLCCTLAKQFNNKLSVIARVRNPEYVRDVSYLRSRLGIEMIINPEYEAAVEASRMLFLPAAISVNSFAHGQAELVKIQIPEGSILDREHRQVGRLRIQEDKGQGNERKAHTRDPSKRREGIGKGQREQDDLEKHDASVPSAG